MCPKTLFTAALITQRASHPLQRCYGPLRIIKGAGQLQTLLSVMGYIDLELISVGVIKDQCASVRAEMSRPSTYSIGSEVYSKRARPQ